MKLRDDPLLHVLLKPLAKRIGLMPFFSDGPLYGLPGDVAANHKLLP
jgi:hypothetical protein